jgi:hypothetical protein
MLMILLLLLFSGDDDTQSGAGEIHREREQIELQLFTKPRRFEKKVQLTG